MSLIVEGTCQPEFEPVKMAFAGLYRAHPELGSACTIFHDGELVVNLWAGSTQKEQGLPWQQDTLVNVFSTGKGVVGSCVQRALDMGLLDLDQKVSYYWPEYGCEGKKDTPVRAFLDHSAGQPAYRTDLPDQALYDWDYMVSTLAKESPWWRPGSQHGYHMMTFGWLIGEVFRRACGITLNQFLQQEFAQPLGLDMGFGLTEEQISRVTDVVGNRQNPEPDRMNLFDKVISDPSSVTARALTNPSSILHGANSHAWRQAELAAANLHSDAASLARLYGEAVCGERVISAAALQRCQQQLRKGADPVLQVTTRFGPGFMLQQGDNVEGRFGPGEKAFGHPGSGGSLAFADPDRRLGFAYVMNQMGPYVLMDPRPVALINAVYECLEF